MTGEKRKMRSMTLVLCTTAVLFVSITSGAQQAADKDFGGSIGSLETGAKTFRPRFEQAIRKSKIGNTSRGQKARRLIRSFERQTQELRENDARAAAYCCGAHHVDSYTQTLDEPKPEAQERMAD